MGHIYIFFFNTNFVRVYDTKITSNTQKNTIASMCFKEHFREHPAESDICGAQ